MIKNKALLKKVLSYVYEQKRLKIDKNIVDSRAGFTQLANNGYIVIFQMKNQYFAIITPKGIETLNSLIEETGGELRQLP
jgi:hypothetical protein